MPIATIIDEVRSYPVDRRAAIADAILQTLNPIDPEVQEEWRRLAMERRNEVMDGKVNSVPTSDVLAEAHFRAVS